MLPWHNPVLLAEQAATLDLLSGGRLDFGIGKGYRYNEFAGFDVPMEEADARFDESLEVLLKAWTSAERFSHHGKYWRFNDIVVEPPSAQKPHPQIWMGAGGERSIRNVAERGFNLLLGQYASPADVGAEQLPGIRTAVEASGRRYDPMRSASRVHFSSPTADRGVRRRRWTRRLQNRMRQLKLATRPDGTVLRRPRPRDRRSARRSTSTARSMAIRTKSPAGCERLRQVGVGYVLINGGGSGGGERGRQSMRRFAREVMPLFADAAVAQAAQ